MSHCIEEIDQILVPTGENFKTWHGLETVAEDAVSKEFVEKQGLHFPIIKTNIEAPLDDQNYDLSNWKAVLADTRNNENIPHDVVPLNVASNKYSVIENGRVWEAMETALAGIEHTVSCVGTLGGLKRYFISIELANQSRETINGDEFHSHLNFITSHDGTLAFETFDAQTRIICSNTLNWSRLEDHNLNLKVHHKSNTDFKIRGMEKLIADALNGRKDFKKVMEEFNSIEVDEEKAKAIVGGYFIVQPNFNEKVGFSTRTKNAIDSITDLYKRGIGNQGKSIYDVMNGATEYWTTGEGVGKTASRGKQVSSSEFGTASKHKVRFVDYLKQGRYNNLLEKSKRVYEQEAIVN